MCVQFVWDARNVMYTGPCSGMGFCKRGWVPRHDTPWLNFSCHDTPWLTLLSRVVECSLPMRRWVGGFLCDCYTFMVIPFVSFVPECFPLVL